VLGDVGHPQLVGCVATELAPNEVRATDPAEAGAAWHPPPRQTLDSELVHDRGDRVVADNDLASKAKLGGDTKRAVDAGRGAMNIDDLAGEEIRRSALGEVGRLRQA
jgi:hypothetical protein